MIIRVAPLLGIILTLGYFAFAGGNSQAPPGGSSGGNARSASASSSLVIVATLTPVPGADDARLASLNAGPPALATPVPTDTAEPEPTETPPAEPTEALAPAAETPVASETPIPSETPTPAETPTPDPSATPTETPTPTATGTATPSATPVTPTVVPLPGLSSAETQIFADHNALRDQMDLRDFRIDDTLMDIARERAAMMAAMQEMTHYNPDGSTVFDMMYDHGYSYVTGSENIHYNYGYSEQQSLRVAVEGWIDSPPHYASMVNPALGRIGIGIATGADGYTYYSVVFSD